MASRKKIPDPEIVPDEVEIEAKPVKQPTRKVVETKTVTYDAPANEEELPEEEDDFDFEEKPKRNKPTLKQEKQKLRDRWAKRGIAPTGNLRISLWKFTNEDDPMSGNQADKAFCSKFVTTESAIDDGIHLDAASKFGPGRYWIMIYLNNQIVDQWEFRVAAGQPMGQIHSQQMVSMPDPQNPNVIVQMPAQQAQPMADPYKDLERSIKLIKSLKELDGPNAGHSEPQTQKSENEMLISALANNPKVVETALDGIFKFGKRNGGGEDDVSWASVVKELITSEHGPLVVREFVGGVFNGFKGMFSGGNNGQATMAQTAFQNHGENQVRPTQRQDGENQAIQESNGQALQSHPESLPEGSIAIRPEDELLAGILDHCKRRMPPRMAADRAFKYAEYVERVAPQQSVFTLIEQFTDNPIEESLALFELLSDEAKEVLAMPHSKQWAMQLQAELKKAYEPGGDANGQ